MFESGSLLKPISEKTGISVPSLSKRAKRDGWKKISSETAPLNLPEGIGRQIKTMAGYGLMDEEIAAVLGIKVELLRESYAKELTTANPEMVARVAQSMFRMATDGHKPNVTAAIFWLKCRAGWNDDPTKAAIGKKQQKQDAAAKVAAGRFSPSSPPKLVVNNR